MPDTTLLDPVVVEHDPDYHVGSHQRCQMPGCEHFTNWFCPGCAKADDCGPASGFYCLGKGRNCFKDNHRKRAKTKA